MCWSFRWPSSSSSPALTVSKHCKQQSTGTWVPTRFGRGGGGGTVPCRVLFDNIVPYPVFFPQKCTVPLSGCLFAVCAAFPAQPTWLQAHLADWHRTPRAVLLCQLHPSVFPLSTRINFSHFCTVSPPFIFFIPTFILIPTYCFFSF